MNNPSLQSLPEITAALSKAGYTASAGESAAYLELQHAGRTYPAVIQLQEKDILISCQVAKIGDFNSEQLSVVAVNALAANVPMLPYAFALLKPEHGGSEEELHASPLVLINSVPVGDLSPEELLWSVEKLQIALAAALEAIATALAVSQAA